MWYKENKLRELRPLGRASFEEMSLSEMMGRHEGTKKSSSSAGRAAMWLLLPPLLVVIVLKTDFLPQVARCKSQPVFRPWTN